MLNDDAYHGDPLKAGDSRYLHRGDMDWAAAEKRGDAKSPEGRVFQAIRKMEKLRAKHEAFDVSAKVALLSGADDTVLGIVRMYGAERLMALFNFSDEPKPALPGVTGTFTDLWTGRKVKAEGLNIAANGFLWLAQKDK